MNGKQARVAWLGVVVLAVGVCAAFSFAPDEEEVAVQAKTPEVSALLPAEAVVYVGVDGRDAHKEAFEKTAAYEAIYKSGLADLFGKVAGYGLQKAGAKEHGYYDLITKSFAGVTRDGYSIAVAVTPGAGPPKPWTVAVLHGGSELEGEIGRTVKSLAGKQLQFETKTIQGRKVTRADVPAPGAPFRLELGWWSEGKHLVIAGGAEAIDSAIAVAEGKRENIATNALWKKYRSGKSDFTVSSVAWFDLGSLRKMFGGMPIPETGTPEKPVTANDALHVLGLQNVNAVVGRSGFRGRATWSETVLDAPGEKTGLLSLFDQQPISLEDLPPLPSSMENLYACSVDWSKAYTTVLGVVREGAKLGPPEAQIEIEGTITQIPALVGFEPKKELFDALGNVVCLYSDPAQGPFNIGGGMIVQLKDAKRFERTINDLLQRAGDAARGELKVVRTKKHGREIVTLEMANGAIQFSYAVTDKWLCVGNYPQSVEAFLLRVDGTLPVWKPSQLQQQALDAVPKKFSSISLTDPRGTYRLLVGLAPAAFSVAKMGLSASGVDLSDFPVTLADVPPAEVVTHSLFPNVSVSTSDENGVTWTSRSSLAGFFGADSVAVAAVGIAVMLPAVQAARQAARRSSSKNNLKQLGLALHNYHETYGQSPAGTNQKTPDLKTEERLSWLAEVLPFLEQQALHQRLDFKKGWKDEANRQTAETQLQVLLNPGVGDDPNFQKGTTHYIGIAGHGKDAATLKLPHKRAGFFGYNRQTRFRDVTDGTSNTLMVTEASKDYGSWAAGGSATIRAFTKKPYVNGPDGIGGPFPGGFNALFGDGSVRFISDKVDPKVLEAISTIAGGETVGEF